MSNFIFYGQPANGPTGSTLKGKCREHLDDAWQSIGFVS
jgi:hypothetical protein